MTDRDLALALVSVQSLEQRARAYAATPAVESDATRTVLRHTVALKLALERMISARVVSTQVLQTG